MADINLPRIGWQNGTLVSKAKVEINGTIYEVEPEEYSGATPLSAENLIQMEENTEDAINEVNVKLEDSIIYSTDEKVIGTWINGKPIYRKVVEFGALPNNTIKEVDHNIDNVGAVTDIRGVIYSSNSSRPIPLIYTGGNIQYSSEISITSTKLRIQTSDNRSSLSANIIIEYTKTTD